MNCLFSCRSTSTWKLPCAPTYLLRSWIDSQQDRPAAVGGLRGERIAQLREKVDRGQGRTTRRRCRPRTPMKTRRRRPQCSAFAHVDDRGFVGLAGGSRYPRWTPIVIATSPSLSHVGITVRARANLGAASAGRSDKPHRRGRAHSREERAASADRPRSRKLWRVVSRSRSQAPSGSTSTRGRTGAADVPVGRSRPRRRRSIREAGQLAERVLRRRQHRQAERLAGRQPDRVVRLAADVPGALLGGQPGEEEERVEPARLELRREPPGPRHEQVRRAAPAPRDSAGRPGRGSPRRAERPGRPPSRSTETSPTTCGLVRAGEQDAALLEHLADGGADHRPGVASASPSRPRPLRGRRARPSRSSPIGVARVDRAAREGVHVRARTPSSRRDAGRRPRSRLAAGRIRMTVAASRGCGRLLPRTRENSLPRGRRASSGAGHRSRSPSTQSTCTTIAVP